MKTRLVQVALPVSLCDRMLKIKEERGITLRAIIMSALKFYLDNVKSIELGGNGDEGVRGHRDRGKRKSR